MKNFKSLSWTLLSQYLLMNRNLGNIMMTGMSMTKLFFCLFYNKMNNKPNDNNLFK